MVKFCLKLHHIRHYEVAKIVLMHTCNIIFFVNDFSSVVVTAADWSVASLRGDTLQGDDMWPEIYFFCGWI